MEFLSHLKVSRKLLILAVLSFIGMVVTGAFGYFAMKNAEDSLNELFHKELLGMYYIGDSRHAMRYAQLQVALLPVAHTPELVQQRQEKYAAAVKEMNECIANYEPLVEDRPSRKEILQEIKADWAKFLTVSEHVMKLAVVDETKQEAIQVYEREGIPVCVKIGGDIGKLQEQALTMSEKRLGNTIDGMDASLFKMTIIVVVVILILSFAIYAITNGITSPLHHVMKVCNDMSEGDFRDNPINVVRTDEFGDMLRMVAKMRATINKLMRQTSTTTEQLAASSQELTASAHQSAQASEQVAQSVTNSASAVVEQQQQVSDAMDAIDHAMVSINHLNDTASQVAQQADASNQQAVTGSKAIETAVGQIVSVEQIVNTSAATVDKLGQRSKEIGQIVETISGIADQTNLLALNAAIEAARAGEQGRGFAVVADEVRKLAEESQVAAQRISSLIGAIQTDTDNAVKSMHDGSVAVKEGTRSVEELKTTFDSICAASDGVMQKTREMSGELTNVMNDTQTIKDRSNRISTNSAKVSTEMESVSAASEEQSASAEEIASASDSLAGLAQDLQTSLQTFKF
ncbi:MAG: methyl-accepting chemotaxis protein [Selenomonadaceae bacterium]|nr:methyl-accepting chemotaxis protein [Selenomonadaceae bacterium]